MSAVTQTISLFVVSDEKQTVERVGALSRGSHITISGSGAVGDDTLNRLTSTHHHVCLIDARSSEDAYLAFARAVLKNRPEVRVVLFGPSDDPTVMARAAASKVWNYLPEFLTYAEFIQAVTDAAAGKPPDEASVFGKMAAALPPPPRPQQQRWFSASPTHSMRGLVQKCLAIGLNADDIARHYDADVETIRGHIAQIQRRSRPSSTLRKSLPYAALSAALLVIAYSALSVIWSQGSQRLAVTGHVQYAAKPLDNGIIEFRSTKAETAVVSGAVIQDGAYRIPARKGLMPGTYVVMISSPEASAAGPAGESNPAAVPPAEERIPGNYNTSSTQRVEVRQLGQNVFDFNIPQPQRLIKRSGPVKRD
jgi:DNA-binding NarL/FixJ family response regulator